MPTLPGVFLASSRSPRPLRALIEPQRCYQRRSGAEKRNRQAQPQPSSRGEPVTGGSARRAFGEDQAAVADHRSRGESASDEDHDDESEAERDQGREHANRMRGKITKN